MTKHLMLALLVFLAVAGEAQCFNPATFDWRSLYTAYPQPIPVKDIAKEDMTCLSSFALCSFANCTVVANTHPPIAECGCVSVTPETFPRGHPYNLGTTQSILSRSIKYSSANACKHDACFGSKVAGAAPFCKYMLPSLGTRGKPAMYGGKFDLISTFNPDAWPKHTKPNQGQAGSGPTICKNGGVFTNCFAAACLEKKSWNGLNTTCYCRYYKTKQEFALASNAAGFSCTGQKVNGKLKYIQNGA